jgi:hypothetical protein
MLRVHLVHAAIGGALFLAGRTGAEYGDGPLRATFYGMLALLPVLAVTFSLRFYVPAFTTATERGLLPWPAPRPLLTD